MDSILDKYILLLQSLRIDNAHGDAPHKPVLLLSLLELVLSGFYPDNKIRVTPELVRTFKSTWESLVTTRHHCNMALPFYHLKSEPFWELIPKSGFEKIMEMKLEMRSLKSLEKALDYAILDPDLFKAMSTPSQNMILRQTILNQYFPGEVRI
jgi:putative restriction endonuclease